MEEVFCSLKRTTSRGDIVALKSTPLSKLFSTDKNKVYIFLKPERHSAAIKIASRSGIIALRSTTLSACHLVGLFSWREE